MTHATAEGTKRYSHQGNLPKHAYRTLGRTGLMASTVGFGCYRIHAAIPEHQTSMAKALLEGCNLIDTSTNYGDGGSEECVGLVVKGLIEEKKLAREDVIVVSKVGYVQGTNLEIAEKRIHEGKPYQEMVEYMEGCWHCMHPDFIREQVELSLKRTGLETLDVYLIHNPEYFLNDAISKGTSMSPEELHGEFYRRIKNAFACLEELVEQGKIRWYGVSSNTLGGSPDNLATTSLWKMHKLAQELPNNHFAVVQLPFNLFETGPLLQRNEGENHGATVLEYAERNGFGILVNRPLNAFFHDRLLRLADKVRDPRGQVHTQDVAEIVRRVDPFVPKSWKEASLSQKSIATIIHSNGVSSVLTGMRTPTYVDDTLSAAKLEPGQIPRELFESLTE